MNDKIEWSSYTSFRNKLIRLIRLQKQNYYYNYIQLYIIRRWYNNINIKLEYR